MDSNSYLHTRFKPFYRAGGAWFKTHFVQLASRVIHGMFSQLHLTVALIAVSKSCPLAADIVTIVDADGSVTSGHALNFKKHTVSVDNGDTREFLTTNLVSLQYKDRQTQTISSSSLVLLANGDRLYVRLIKVDEDQIEFRWPDFPAEPPLLIPLETVRGIVFKLPKNIQRRRRLIKDLHNFRQDTDEVALLNGDKINGEFRSADSNNLSLDTTVGEVTVRHSQAGGLGFNSTLISFPKTAGQRVLMRLTQGTRLTVRNLKLDSQRRFVCDALFGTRMVFPETAVVSMRFLGGRVAYVSDLKPQEYRFTPYLSSEWKMQSDLSVTGDALYMRGIEYDKGLGMHSKSEVSYDLADGYRNFQATVGIDDTANGQGSVEFRIHLDGRRVFTTGPVTGKSPPRKLPPIDVTGKRRLTLIVDYGQFGDIRDYADWCNALLIK